MLSRLADFVLFLQGDARRIWNALLCKHWRPVEREEPSIYPDELQKATRERFVREVEEAVKKGGE